MGGLFGSRRSQGCACLAFYPQGGVAMAWVVAASTGQPVVQALAQALDRRQVADWVRTWKMKGVPFVGLFHPARYPLLPVTPPSELPREEWPGHLRWSLIDRLGFPVEEAVVELLECPRATPPLVLYVAAARRQEVLDCAAFFRQQKLRLEAIGIWELALCGLASLLPEANRPAAILYLDGETTLLVVVDQGLVQLVRRLLPGEPLGRPAEDLAREVARGIAFYEQQSPGSVVERLWLLSPYWSLQELHLLLLQHLALPVSFLAEMATDLGLVGEGQQLCLPALGAAWRREMGS